MVGAGPQVEDRLVHLARVQQRLRDDARRASVADAQVMRIHAAVDLLQVHGAGLHGGLRQQQAVFDLGDLDVAAEPWPRACRAEREREVRGERERKQDAESPLRRYFTAVTRGKLAAFGMIRVASWPSHCSSSEQ